MLMTPCIPPVYCTTGITKLWLQPGAHNADVLAAAKDLNLQLIYGGPCLLVQLGYDDDWTSDEPRASL